MKGSKGECLFFENKEMVYKTKFDTEKNCQARIKSLIGIEVLKEDTVAYKCKVCGFWHLGKPIEAAQYGK